jgi:hypothetical protein
VLDERRIAVRIPNVPLAIIPAPAISPSSYRDRPKNSTLAPVPKKGMRRAKSTKGISIRDLLRTVFQGKRATVIARPMMAKYER